MANALAISRAAQIDARRLDDELAAALASRAARCASATHRALFPHERLSALRNRLREEAYDDEVLASVKTCVYALTRGLGRASPGEELMNLRARDETRWLASADAIEVKTGVEGEGLSVLKRVVYGAVSCGGAYAWGKWRRKMARERFDEEASDGWKYRAWRMSQVAERAHTLASFVNFCVFLRCGAYPTLLDRVLSARLVYQRPTMQRVVDYEYLNQQLAWREISDLMLFTLPYLYSTRVRSVLGALARPMSSTAAPSAGTGRTRIQAYECVACGCGEPVHPFIAVPCGHPYCYYCLRSRMLDSATCPCVKCSQPVAEMRRLVMTSAASSAAHR